MFMNRTVILMDLIIYERPTELLNEVGIPKTTYHGLRDSHASFLLFHCCI